MQIQSLEGIVRTLESRLRSLETAQSVTPRGSPAGGPSPKRARVDVTLDFPNFKGGAPSQPVAQTPIPGVVHPVAAHAPVALPLTPAATGPQGRRQSGAQPSKQLMVAFTPRPSGAVPAASATPTRQLRAAPGVAPDAPVKSSALVVLPRAATPSLSRTCISCKTTEGGPWREAWTRGVHLCNPCGLKWGRTRAHCMMCKSIPTVSEVGKECCGVRFVKDEQNRARASAPGGSNKLRSRAHKVSKVPMRVVGISSASGPPAVPHLMKMVPKDGSLGAAPNGAPHPAKGRA